MQKQIPAVLLVGMMMVSLCTSGFPSTTNKTTGGSMIYVDSNNTMGPWEGTLEHPYQYIQDGIDNASTGYTVYVLSGTYHEHVIVDVSIDVIGEQRDTTIIDAEYSGNGVYITVDHVQISGFTIQDYGACFSYGGIHVQANHTSISKNTLINTWDTLDYKYGILVKHAFGNTITNCYSYNNDFGIYLYNAVHTSIVNCSSDNNEHGPDYGIRLMSSSNTTVKNCKSNNYLGLLLGNSSENHITDNAFDGIYLADASNNNTVIENTITYTTLDGILIQDSQYNNCSHNCITTSYRHGFFLLRSSNNTIYNNTITTTQNGISLQSSTGNHLFMNTITQSKLYSISLEDASYNNKISSNTIRENAYGTAIDASSSDNTIYHNNFINNNHNAYDFCSNSWDNDYPSGGNYWDDYTGTDTNDDDIGDTPYPIPGDSNEDRYPLMTTWGDQNYPPFPPGIAGPTAGKAGIEYQYTFVVRDPNGDNVYLYIDWGDNHTEEWRGPFSSGEEITLSHTWSEKGTYMIKAKAKDIYDMESPWGTLEISMPQNKHSITSLCLHFLNYLMQRFPLLEKFVSFTIFNTLLSKY
jgi:parallel beta-helix repeat protein